MESPCLKRLPRRNTMYTNLCRTLFPRFHSHGSIGATFFFCFVNTSTFFWFVNTPAPGLLNCFSLGGGGGGVVISGKAGMYMNASVPFAKWWCQSPPCPRFVGRKPCLLHLQLEQPPSGETPSTLRDYTLILSVWCSMR